MRKTIVITGLGLVSPLGNNVNDTWMSLKKGEVGIREIDQFDTSKYETKIAGTIKNFLITDFLQKKITKKFDFFIQYGIAAGIQAIEDAKIHDNTIRKNKIGIIFGSGIGGLTSIEKNHKILMKYGPKRISPLFISGCIINTISGYLSILYKLTGPNLAIATSCATGGHAICLAEQLINENKAKIIITGGAEKASTPLAISGFSATKALSKNKNPKEASRPWDVNRDGFVIGDGAACIVLEEYQHAINRGAKIYAELASTSMNADGYHLTTPKPNGKGVLNCMKNALKMAKITANQLNYINAHATSTKHGDISESLAIKKLLDKHPYKKTIINSTKSMTGHMLGASGSIEAILTILSLKYQLIVSNINLKTIDPQCKGLNYITRNKKINIKYAMSNSFGFGGTNSSIIIKKL